MGEKNECIEHNFMVPKDLKMFKWLVKKQDNINRKKHRTCKAPYYDKKREEMVK